MQLLPHLRRARAADAPGALPVRVAKETARFARARALNPSVRRVLTRGGGLAADDREG